MKYLIVMVGPPGCGKSTYAKNYVGPRMMEMIPKTIISQDEMGPKKHYEEFIAALKRDDKIIIIDRMNHTREQRARYLTPAKGCGYNTIITVRNEPFGTCLERILAREKHPTIPKGDMTTAIQALRTFFQQYQRPTADEAAVVQYSFYDPYLMDLSRVKRRRTLTMGDGHGCYDEVMELLASMGYRVGEDMLIIPGDIIDRGPKIRELLQFVMNTPNVFVGKGNHEDKLARHLANLGAALVSKVKIGHGLQNTINQCGDLIADPKFLGWLWSLPLMFQVNNNFFFHAGINPRFPLQRQTKEFLIYARKFNADTNTFDDESAPYWHEAQMHQDYEGKRLFFGHEIHPHTQVKDRKYGSFCNGWRLRIRG